MSTSFFDAHSTNVINIFSKNNFYVIPYYQRGYAWGKEQINQMIDDFLEAIDNGSDIYFTGPVTLIKVADGKDHSGTEYRVYELVDGQQRLTTFSLLAKVLLEYLPFDLEDEGVDPKRIEQVRHRLLVVTGIDHSDNISIPEHGKLQFPLVHKRHSDFETYRNIMEDGDTSQSRISDAYHIIIKRIEKLADQSGTSVLKFADFFLNRVHLIKIVTENEDISYQIFETLNNRGEMLTPLDLIRNRIFRSIYEFNHKKLDDAHKLWNDRLSKMDGVFDSRSVDKNLQQIMTVILNIHKKDWIETKDLYKKLKQELETESNPYKLLELLLNENAIGACTDICKGERSARNKSRDLYIEQASQFAILHPLLYVLFMRDAHDCIIREVARISSNYVKRVQLATGRVPPIKKTGKVMAEIAARWNDGGVSLQKSNCKNIVEDLRDTLRKADTDPELIARNVFDDEAFRQSISSRPNIDEKHAKQALIDIANHHRESEGQSLHKNADLHLEHIFPQKAKLAQWPSFNESHLVTHLRRLGNLTLLGQKLNESASNRSYEEKKDVYRNSTLLNTRSIPEEYPEWTPSAIEKREQRLLDELVKVWSL